MASHVRSWLNSALYLRDPIERQQAPLVQVLLLGIIALSLLGLPLTVASQIITAKAKIIASTGLLIGLASYALGLVLLRRGGFTPAITSITVGMLLSLLVVMMPRGLNSSWINFFLLALPITFAGLLGRRWLLWLIIGLSVAALVLLGVLGKAMPGLVGYDAPGATLSGEILISFVLVAGFLGLCFDRFGSALREAVRIAQQREHELEGVRAAQETLIAERTAELRSALAVVEQREQQLSHTLTNLREAQEVVREMSAPVLPVLPGVLVAPLVGALDSARAEALTHNTLREIEQQSARHVIFDITGVPLVDTHVAQVLIQTASAAQLLGAQVLLVGVRPEVAQTMISLGIALPMFATYPDLRGAVAELLQHDGWVRT